MKVVKRRQNCCPSISTSSCYHFAKHVVSSPYLLFVEDGAEAVEELEGRQDLALNQDAGYHRCCRP